MIRDMKEEGQLWKDRFAIVVRGGQDLSFILARVEERVDVFSTPAEIHRLFACYREIIEMMKMIAQQS